MVVTWKLLFKDVWVIKNDKLINNKTTTNTNYSNNVVNSSYNDDDNNLKLFSKKLV